MPPIATASINHCIKCNLVRNIKWWLLDAILEQVHLLNNIYKCFFLIVLLDNAMPNASDMHDNISDHQLAKDKARRNIRKSLKFCDFSVSELHLLLICLNL